MRRTAFLGVLLALALAQAAAAHVEARPPKVAAGSVARITFDVPAEEKVPAIKFSVQVPAGVSNISLRPTAGWQNVLNGRIAVWSGGRISPGNAARFSLTARWPATPGKKLVFPAVEKYANGKVVFWIGPESSETPAARVLLTGEKASAPPPAVATTSTTKGKSRSAGWLIAAGVAIGLAALGLVSLWRRRH